MIITLPSTHAHLREIRDYANSLTRPKYPLANPLKHVIAAGALYNKRGISGFSPRDKLWLREAATALGDTHLALAPDFCVTPMNINDGTDILSPDSITQGDVLVVCFIPTTKCSAETIACHDGSNQRAVLGAFQQSPYAIANAWQKTAETTDVRAIISYSINNEICAKDFIADDYILFSDENVITTPFVSSYERHPAGRTLSFKQELVLRRDLYEEVKWRQRQAQCSF